MTFNTANLPNPKPLEKFVGITINYGGGVTNMECVGLSLVRIVEPPDYPDTECLLARIIHEQTGPKTYQTSLFVIPLEYVTGLDLVALPAGLALLPPSKELFICPDKPAAKNRLPVATIKHRLGEFGVIF